MNTERHRWEVNSPRIQEGDAYPSCTIDDTSETATKHLGRWDNRIAVYAETGPEAYALAARVAMLLNAHEALYEP